MNDMVSTGRLRAVPAPASPHPKSDQLKATTGAFDDLLDGLHQFLDIDPHGRRTAWLALKLSLAMGIDNARVETIVAAAATHDIGKLFIPEIIKEKPGRLTSHESIIMRYHTALGRDLLEGMRKQCGEGFDFGAQASVALLHHERWDGSGYPFKLKGSDIPLEARIVSVADVFDALTAARSYKPAWPAANAIQMIHDERGMQFDPECVDAFVSLSEELETHWPRLSDDIQRGNPIPLMAISDHGNWLSPPAESRSHY